MPHLMDSTCKHCDEFRTEGWNFCGNCDRRLRNTCPGCPEREEELQVVRDCIPLIEEYNTIFVIFLQIILTRIH